MLNVIMLNVIMLNVIMLNVITLNVIMLNFILLSVFMMSVSMWSVFMLNVVVLSVVAPRVTISLFPLSPCAWLVHGYSVSYVIIQIIYRYIWESSYLFIFQRFPNAIYDKIFCHRVVSHWFSLHLKKSEKNIETFPPDKIAECFNFLLPLNARQNRPICPHDSVWLFVCLSIFFWSIFQHVKLSIYLSVYVS